MRNKSARPCSLYPCCSLKKALLASLYLFGLRWTHGGELKHKMGFLKTVSLFLGLVVLSVALCRAQAQSSTLKYEVDPTWPKPLPENWVTGQVSGVCVDGQDHVFIVNRNDMTDKEAEVSRQAPPFIEFDADGKVVNSFGDWKTAPNTTHGCIIDYENNFWTAGNGDGIIQKYSHDGRLMMQIGKRGVVDSSDRY
jgi:hypothetical protein